MKSENRRIFISDLPETSTKEELEDSFSKYGKVSSVDVKERKELGPNNKSLFFAYINLITDEKSLTQCFQELSNTKWHGQYVQLQIARENFLERLKREREETGNNQKVTKVKNEGKEIISRKSVENQDISFILQKNPIQVSKKYKSSSESETDNSDSESDTNFKNNVKPKPNIIPEILNNAEEKSDITIKCNKNKLHHRDGLKIPSVGRAPIIEITKSKSKLQQNDSEANKKRLQSLQNRKKGYAAQKLQIKNALSYGTNKPNNNIVFDDSNNTSTLDKNLKINGHKANVLFHEGTSEEDSDFDGNFDVKEQFQGKSGQKLLELQSSYKNDQRFSLDKRFMDAEKDENKEILDAVDSPETEKKEQLKILEEILGKKITPNYANKKDNATRKTMLKFDPSQPEHSNLELTVSEPEKNRRKKDKIKEELQESQKREPEVSKEIFYKVPETLKETFEGKPQFSLLSMFGRTEQNKDGEQQNETEKAIKGKPFFGSKNPFKYDSSDEDETEDIPHKDTVIDGTQTQHSEQTSIARTNQSVFWTEPFFFKNDDFRLQEGLDFIEKIKTEDKEFMKIRRELKGIVKAKRRNNERKNKMFKKKLGGNKRRKHIRIKKALKR